MFKIKRYKFLSRKHGIIEKNCSDKSCRVLFIDLIILTLDGVAKVRGHINFFLMEHPTFDSRYPPSKFILQSDSFLYDVRCAIEDYTFRSKKI